MMNCFNLRLYLGRVGDQWNYMLLPKGQVNEKKCIDLTMVKPGLNLRKKMQGNEQEVEGPKRTLGRNLAEISCPYFPFT